MYEDWKEKEVLETVRGKDLFPLLCRLDRLQQNLCYACVPSSIFQRVIGLHSGIVLIVSLLVAVMKDHVALLEEQVVTISPLYSGGMTVVYSVDQTLPPHVEVGWLARLVF